MEDPCKILIVDDEPFNIDYLEQELEDLGYNSISASNGQEALELINAEPPDMILLDIMMPVMDGFEVLAELKGNENWRHIPVVVISAMSDIKSVIKGIEMGADDYLPKPFEPILLQARIKACLEKKRLRDLEQQYLMGLERELEIGREIQADFLPKEIPQPEGWEIAAFFRAAREVAGDFYDIFEIPKDNIGIIIGDVVDKGVGAALYMTLFRSLLRITFGTELTPKKAGDEKHSTHDHISMLKKAVSSTNDYICRIHQSASFATLFFGILDPSSGTLSYIDAGHEPPLVLRAGQVTKELAPTGPAVGVFEDADFNSAEIQLSSGDILFIYSDGITDIQNLEGKMLGQVKLVSLLEKPAASAEALLTHIIKDADHFKGSADQFDDITLIAIRKN